MTRSNSYICFDKSCVDTGPFQSVVWLSSRQAKIDSVGSFCIATDRLEFDPSANQYTVSFASDDETVQILFRAEDSETIKVKSMSVCELREYAALHARS